MRKAAISFLAALALSVLTPLFAQEGPGAASESEQVKKLKAELQEMRAEMDAMRKAVETSKTLSPEERQSMEQHMHRMGEKWGYMHDHCGMH